MAPSSRRRPKSLSHGRVPKLQGTNTSPGAPAQASRSSARSIASKHTRRVIRGHHTLQKRLSQAVQANDPALASSIQAQLDEAGGLQLYQEASVNGASKARGGDTSKKLVEFLGGPLKERCKQHTPMEGGRIKMLDVGALMVDTAAARSGAFDIVRIDLQSRDKGIAQQDFMERPMPGHGPAGDKERFDILCLSLVLNYVPDAKARGDMLKRTCAFLRMPSERDSADGIDSENNFGLPALFLVLPAPCIMNSRYLNQERLEEIMKSLGFSLWRKAFTDKLAYLLWHWSGEPQKSIKLFPKATVNPGRTRNNFAIIVD